MTISSLDPSGELGRLFSAVQPKSVAPQDQRQSTQVSSLPTQDDVALSGFAQEVRELTKLVNQQPDVREDRVQEIRKAIQMQSLHVRSEEIADALTRDTVLNALALS